MEISTTKTYSCDVCPDVGVQVQPDGRVEIWGLDVQTFSIEDLHNLGVFLKSIAEHHLPSILDDDDDDEGGSGPLPNIPEGAYVVECTAEELADFLRALN